MQTETEAFIAQLRFKLFLSPPMAVTLATELIERFLPIKRSLKDFDNKICSPSPMIEKAWQELILFTKFYASLCRGSFIHYDPTVAKDLNSVKAKKYQRTLQAYEDLFGALPPADNNIWPTNYPGLEEEEDNSDSSLPPLEPIRSSLNSNKRKATETLSKAIKKAAKQQPAGDNSQQKRSPFTAPSSSTIVATKSCIRIHVMSQTGETTTLVVNTTDSVEDVKIMLHSATGTPPENQRLLFDDWGRLQDHHTLDDYDITNETTIFLALEQSGC